VGYNERQRDHKAVCGTAIIPANRSGLRYPAIALPTLSKERREEQSFQAKCPLILLFAPFNPDELLVIYECLDIYKAEQNLYAFLSGNS
jgi:hypothetical protein